MQCVDAMQRPALEAFQALAVAGTTLELDSPAEGDDDARVAAWRECLDREVETGQAAGLAGSIDPHQLATTRGNEGTLRVDGHVLQSRGLEEDRGFLQPVVGGIGTVENRDRKGPVSAPEHPDANAFEGVKHLSSPCAWFCTA